jgi:hypothetical protein
VGKPLAVRDVAADGAALHTLLSGMSLQLMHEGKTVETGLRQQCAGQPFDGLAVFFESLAAVPWGT